MISDQDYVTADSYHICCCQDYPLCYLIKIFMAVSYYTINTAVRIILYYTTKKITIFIGLERSRGQSTLYELLNLDSLGSPVLFLKRRLERNKSHTGADLFPF